MVIVTEECSGWIQTWSKLPDTKFVRGLTHKTNFAAWRGFVVSPELKQETVKNTQDQAPRNEREIKKLKSGICRRLFSNMTQFVYVFKCNWKWGTKSSTNTELFYQFFLVKCCSSDWNLQKLDKPPSSYTPRSFCSIYLLILFPLHLHFKDGWNQEGRSVKADWPHSLQRQRPELKVTQWNSSVIGHCHWGMKWFGEVSEWRRWVESRHTSHILEILWCCGLEVVPFIMLLIFMRMKLHNQFVVLLPSFTSSPHGQTLLGRTGWIQTWSKLLDTKCVRGLTHKTNFAAWRAAQAW